MSSWPASSPKTRTKPPSASFLRAKQKQFNNQDSKTEQLHYTNQNKSNERRFWAWHAVARLPSKNTQKTQVGCGFDAFLFLGLALLDGLLLLLGRWVAVLWVAAGCVGIGWWRPAALHGSWGVLVVVVGFGTAAAHCCWLVKLLWLWVGEVVWMEVSVGYMYSWWVGVWSDLRIEVRSSCCCWVRTLRDLFRRPGCWRDQVVSRRMDAR